MAIALIAAFLTAINVGAATWTVHGTKENWMSFVVRHWNNPNQELRIIWNFYQFPYEQASGLYDSTYSDIDGSLIGYTETLAYQDSWTVNAPDGSIAICELLWGGGPDDYSGWWDYPFGRPSTFGNWIQYPGEFWIDFDSTGTPRLSTSKPSDFGKWLWDGSFNPNYIDPLSVVPQKSKRGRGHNK